ncbi:hypothetical protein INR49_024223 [Caranx melampygus]|nr:hypothetical protein INR49_024223 [Caranx melampygus]
MYDSKYNSSHSTSTNRNNFRLSTHCNTQYEPGVVEAQRQCKEEKPKRLGTSEQRDWLLDG